MKRQFSISLEEDLIQRTDEFSKTYGLSRSNFIAVALATYMDAKQQVPNIQLQLDELKALLNDI